MLEQRLPRQRGLSHMKGPLEFFATLFETNPGWWAKVAGAAGCGLVMSVAVAIKAWRSVPWGAMVAMLVAFPLFGAAAGMLLATADATRCKIRAGQRSRRSCAGCYSAPGYGRYCCG